MTTTLDIISDPVCPWCHIGKAKLDAALTQRPDHPFEIRWQPFQLNPDMPPEGMDRRAYLEDKFGGADGAAQVCDRIAEAAAEAGLTIDFARIARTPNTLDAHRLIRWAGIEGRQTAVVSRLFERYFQQGEDIGDHAVLVDVAQGTGMDADATRRLLAGPADRAEVAAEDARAREMGVQGVPTFVVGGKYVVTGAQDADLWLRVIDELAAQTRALAERTRGQA